MDSDGIDERFVGVGLLQGGSWTLVVPSRVDRLAEVAAEFRSVYERFVEAAEPFVVPTALEYSLTRFERDGPTRAAVGVRDPELPAYCGAERLRLADETGVESIPVDETARADRGARVIKRVGDPDAAVDPVVCIGDVAIDHTRTRVSLHGYEGWVDRNDATYARKVDRDGRREGPLERDPVAIKLGHTGATGLPDAETAYAITVLCHSDLWLRETPVGERNRRRLRAVFERLFARFTVAKTLVSSEYHGASTLRALLPTTE
jgi:hypothetical protein